MVAMTKESRQKIEKASRDRAILRVPLYLVQKVHGLSHRSAREAVRLAEDRLRKDNRAWERAQTEVERDKLLDSVANAEQAYPGINMQVARTNNFSTLADAYGITRERVRQIRKALDRLAEIMGKSSVVVADMAQKGSLPVSEQRRIKDELGIDDE